MPADGRSWKAVMLEEVGAKLDMARVHFTGRIPHEGLVALFRISRAHIYYTYPFVLSWSLVEAMGCEALIIGSDTPPLAEVMRDGENGILLPFHDHRRGWPRRWSRRSPIPTATSLCARRRGGPCSNGSTCTPSACRAW
jgi:hypothetical protein